MRLLLDQGLPRGSADELRRLGHDAVHTGEIGLATAADAYILAHARADLRTIVTLDADFHALLALSYATSPSVIRIRIEGLRGAELAALLERVLALCDEDLRRGAMVSVEAASIRVRALPLAP